jgi:hypothetical protein
MPDPLFNMSLKTRRAGLSSHPVDQDEWRCPWIGMSPVQRTLPAVANVISR